LSKRNALGTYAETNIGQGCGSQQYNPLGEVMHSLSRTNLTRPTALARSIAIALALMGLATSYSALAQAPAPVSAPAPADEKKAEDDKKKKDSVDKVESIIVTAGKRAQEAAQVPYNVSAINGDTLREQNITDVKKLIADSVEINAPGNSARFADSVTVRGLNVQRLPIILMTHRYPTWATASKT
jgi:outer membrane receptor protein involved in Fe transport